MTAKSSLPRVAALVGPFGSGKTTLLESLLFATRAVPRKGTVAAGTTIGDSSAEARQRLMTTELTVASTEYLGDRWTFIDCPGSIEFFQDTCNALLVVDAAVVVVDPEPSRALMAVPLLKFLDQRSIPHVIFINKVESGGLRLRETFEALQTVSDRPLVLREVPIHDGETVTGFVDLVSERAFQYRQNQPSDMIKLPESQLSDEQNARQQMLEHLADLDDTLLEALLEDAIPPSDVIYENIARDLAADLIVPVFFGSAAHDNGIRRLLKCLRHDVPDPKPALVGANGAAIAQVFKTVHAQHTGKLSYARVWQGEFTEGETVDGVRPTGLFAALGATLSHAAKAGPGDVVAFGRLDAVRTGDILGGDNATREPWPAPLPPLLALAVHTSRKEDDVKLSAALTRLTEEDPSLSVARDAEGGELVLWGQGEIHLQVALERLHNRFNLTVTGGRRRIGFKETIRKPATQHGRHKRQSGGHGQFGDIHITIEPQARGAGFEFVDKIVGGAVPRQYIPSVAIGVEEFLKQGPLGFPVVDLKVTLTDGSYHTVDSSDMAFRTAARIAMSEGLPKCEPVLLEPILAVEIAVPAEFTSKAQRIISGRRGQILGYEAKDGWKGWDVVSALLPQAEVDDLIIELRSLTMGVGTFSWRFDHLQELTGRGADKIVEERKAALAAQ
jgi:elongation factor G